MDLPAKVIDEIGRRAMALLEAAKSRSQTPSDRMADAEAPQRLLLAKEHYTTRGPDMLHPVEMPTNLPCRFTQPTEADKAWAKNLTRGVEALDLSFRASGTSRRSPVDAESSTPTPSPSSSPRTSGIALDDFTPPASPGRQRPTDFREVPPLALDRQSYAVDLLSLPELTRPLLSGDDSVEEYILGTPRGSPVSRPSSSSSVALESFTPRSSPTRFDRPMGVSWVEEHSRSEETPLVGSEIVERQLMR